MSRAAVRVFMPMVTAARGGGERLHARERVKLRARLVIADVPVVPYPYHGEVDAAESSDDSVVFAIIIFAGEISVLRRDADRVKKLALKPGAAGQRLRRGNKLRHGEHAGGGKADLAPSAHFAQKREKPCHAASCGEGENSVRLFIQQRLDAARRVFIHLFAFGNNCFHKAVSKNTN